MAEADAAAALSPRLYLISPSVFAPDVLAAAIARAAAGGDVACLRLRLGDLSKKQARAAVEAIKPVCVEADVALVLEDAAQLAAETGADGVHLSDGARRVKKARDALGPDAIVGAFCGASKHAGLVAGDSGANYVSFGPWVAARATDADETLADAALFEWWAEMIELPVVAEGGVTAETLCQARPQADFIALGPEVWSVEDPESAVRAVSRAMTPG